MSVSMSLPAPAVLHSEYSRRAAEGRAAAVREIAPGTPRVIRLPAVEALTGIRKTKIYDLMKDGQFPKPIALSLRARGWLEDEVLDWITERAATRA
jgi:prophage regulatory protein